MAKRGPNFSKFLLNCEESRGRKTDWTFSDAVTAQSVASSIANLPPRTISEDLSKPPPITCDLRQPWWNIRDQGKTGACVGFATADGVLRWLYVKNKLLQKTDLPSPRFIWMANKETDDITRYPTTFLEPAGTSTKLALGIAQKYGCVPEHMLPMNGALSVLSANVFFSIAAQFRITAYYGLGTELEEWRMWIARAGPILTRLVVDDTWKRATQTNGRLEKYSTATMYGGHAVCLVGYTSKHFIVRNSWGTNWGDQGFAYASNAYAEEAFTEAYGAVL